MNIAPTRSRRARLVSGGAAIVALGVAITIGVATPAFAAGSYPTLAASNIRSSTNTSASIVKTVAKGATLAIDCYSNGQNVSGTTLWDHVPAYNGFISDSLLLTGSNSAVVPPCGSSAPAAPATKTFPTLAASNIRSASNTSAPIITTVAKGTRLAVDCYVNGQNVSSTTIWEHVPAYNGFISDSLLLTGSNSAVVPLCGGSSSAPAAPAATREDNAVSWALSEVGSSAYTTVTTVNGRTVYQGWCLKFAANAYGKTAAGYNTAMDMYNALHAASQIHTGTAPKGALVFSYSSYDISGGVHQGHVSLAVGDGRYVMGGVIPSSTHSSVAVFTQANPAAGATILGWAYAPSSWTGR